MNKKINIFIVVVIIILNIIIIFFINKSNNKKNYEKITFKDLESKLDNSVNLNENNETIIKVHISGEVYNPGLIELKVGDRIFDAIELAGGLTDEANISKINLAYILSDGEKIYIPNENVEGYDEQDYSYNSKKININIAKIEELKNIPGVGENTAQAIIEYRNKNRKI